MIIGWTDPARTTMTTSSGKNVIVSASASFDEETKEKREDMVSFVLNCTAYDLQKMYERMKELKK